MFGEAVLWLMLLAIPVAMIYLATQHPTTWQRMCEEDRRKKKEWLGTAFRVGGAAWKNYHRK